MPQKIILRSFQSPGDIVMLTAAVRELHRQYAGKFVTDVRTSTPAIWEHNPYLTPIADGDREARVIEMHYPLIHQSNQRPVHFLEGYTDYLAAQLGLPSLRPREFRGDIYLSEEERTQPGQVPATGHQGDYWLINAGSKRDFTCKQWPPENFQAVVDHFRGRLTFVQTGALEHNHPPLDGVIDLRGKTDHRQLIRLVYHAAGVLTGVSYPMHLAAAVPLKEQKEAGRGNQSGRLRPCVVVAGGREPAHWEQYPGHQFLHTIGALNCCASGGCWKSRVVALGDGDNKDRDLCHQPVDGCPRCMRLISAEDVIRAVEKYLEVGNRAQGTGHRGECVPRKVGEAISGVSDKGRDGPGGPSSGKRVLIDFRHGLGDAVQLTTVLAHLRHYYPDWQIDVAAGVGKLPRVGHREQGTGNRQEEEEQRADEVDHERLYRRFLARDRETVDRGAYDRVFELAWDECPVAYADCPSTKAEYCLRSVFKLEPIPELCRYELPLGSEALAAAKAYLKTICPAGTSREGRYPVVLVHYQANTSTEKKNLPHELARKVCEVAMDAGYVPVILDWDKRSPLPDGVRIFNPGCDAPVWGGIGTGDCETLAALIAQASLFIGVDSGPLHVAGATSTPAIAVWTGHHPLHYFGLAEQVTHLVPEDHASRLRGDRAAGMAYFERNYRHRAYRQIGDALPALVREMLTRDGDGLVRARDFWVRADNVEQDLVIVRDIAEQDSYRLAELDVPGPIVVDVGAHVGVFSRALKRRHPSARVVAVECCPENIAALNRNIGDFAAIVPAALTYQREVALLNAVYPGCVSTGGSTVVARSELAAMMGPKGARPSGEYWLDGRPLATLTLEELMAEQGLERVDVLKLDCEGSEFSILENTTSLDRIGAIVGEYHGRERFLDLVARRFKDWELRILRDGDPVTFWLLPKARQSPARVADGMTPECEASSRARGVVEAHELCASDACATFWPRFQSVLHPFDQPAPVSWRRYYTTLFELAAELRPRRVCEIGVRAGYSAFAILSANPEAIMLGIEADLDEAAYNTHGGRKGLWRHAEKILAPYNYQLLLANSHALTGLPRSDLVYIDGDHTFEGCLADLRLAQRSTEVILVDDYDSIPSVAAACDAFAAEFPGFTTRYIANGLTGFKLFDRRQAGSSKTSIAW